MTGLHAIVIVAMGAMLAAACVWAEAAESSGGRRAVRIARFRGDRKAAISFTFDDAMADHVALAVPLLEEFGYRGTFYLVTGWIKRDAKADPVPESAGKDRPADARPSWEEWKELAARGHEIGNHSTTHAKLTDVKGEAALEQEIIASERLIAEKIGRAPLSFSYPYCASNPQIKAMTLRCHALDRGRFPGYGDKDFTAAGVNHYIDEAIEKGMWHVALVHGVCRADEWRKHLAWVKEREGNLWVGTYADVGRYVRERDAATLEVVSRAASSVTFTLMLPPDLRPDWFNVPLTVVVEAGPGASSPAATRQGPGRAPAVRAADGKLLADVEPGPDRVTVTWKTAK